MVCRQKTRYTYRGGQSKINFVYSSKRCNLEPVEELDTQEKRQKSSSKSMCLRSLFLSGFTMALRVLDKINARLNFLFRENQVLDVLFQRFICNALICNLTSLWLRVYCMVRNLTKKLKDKLHVTQYKYIRFCLKLKCRKHISNTLKD